MLLTYITDSKAVLVEAGIPNKDYPVILPGLIMAAAVDALRVAQVAGMAEVGDKMESLRVQLAAVLTGLTAELKNAGQTSAASPIVATKKS